MVHPVSGGEYPASASQVPFLKENGWQVVEGQDEQGEEWPAELQRFEGQPLVWIRHPDVDGDPIPVGASSVPIHRSSGWYVVEDESSSDAEDDGPASEDGRDDLTVEELKDEARARGLPVSGTKAELLERLRGEQTETEQDAGAEDESAPDDEEREAE